MNTRFAKGLGGAAAVVVLAACYTYPDNEERLNDTIVLTRYDASASFSSYTTFAVRPQIPYITGSTGSEVQYVDDATAATLVNAITRNMTARGYTPAPIPDMADLGVEIAVTKQLNAQQVCYPYYYWGAYWTPYYWGYPGYAYYAPWGCTYSTWTTGTVIYDILDLKAPATGAPRPSAMDGGVVIPDGGSSPSVPAIWFGATYGALVSTTADNVNKALAGIDQSFAQSPYLHK